MVQMSILSWRARMRLNLQAVLSLPADDELSEASVVELSEASLCVLHCKVKVMSKVNLGWQRLPKAAEGCVGCRRLSKGLQGCQGLEGCRKTGNRLARFQGLPKAVEVVEGCQRLLESAKVEGVSELKRAC